MSFPGKLTILLPAAFWVLETHRRLQISFVHPKLICGSRDEVDSPELLKARLAHISSNLSGGIGLGLGGLAARFLTSVGSWRQDNWLLPTLQPCDSGLNLSWAASGSLDLNVFQSASFPPSSAQYVKAAALAQQHQAELARLRQLLAHNRVALPKGRFGENDAELMRFAITQGLCDSISPAQREAALEKTVERVAEAVEWLQSQQFMTQERLERWLPLLHWEDTEEHPLLVIRLGRATQECSGEELDEFAEAIISQVQAALETRFSDEAGRPEQMTVVTDCTGASTLQASHVLKLIKRVSLTLNRFYPGRLHCFYLVDLPRMLRWPVKAIIALGHPSTRAKVIICQLGDARLPPELSRKEAG